MRTGTVAALLSAALLATAAGPGPGPGPAAHATGTVPDGRPLPARMADTGGGDQLITATADGTGATRGVLVWWDRRDGRWTATGSAPARFGAGGLVEGTVRRQDTGTTPTGLYRLPFAFGLADPPAGTRLPHRPVRESSWWCQDNASPAYNRWTDPRPAHCRASEAEHLVDHPAQYAHALVTGFNYDRPVRGRGAGIFLHADGAGATAGCVSVPAAAMVALLRWADPARRPHIAIGTRSGPTAVTRY
ncbi:L,D-transpeptidase family protein [Streptomyces sp. JNUCC 64]